MVPPHVGKHLIFWVVVSGPVSHMGNLFFLSVCLSVYLPPEALPTPSQSLPAPFEALPAPSEALSALSETVPALSEALPALS